MLRSQLLQDLRPLHHLILMNCRNSQLLVLDGSLVARVVLRIVPTGGMYHLQSPFTTMVGESRLHLLPITALTTFRIRVLNLNIKLRASTLVETTTTSLREGVTIITPSPLAKEDVTLAMIMHAMYDKNRGIKMVSPLLRLGLNHHMFVFMCVLSCLELSRHYSYL